MQFAIVAATLLASLVMSDPLEERLPVCSEHGGKCDHRIFFCCQGQNLVCVSISQSGQLSCKGCKKTLC